MNSIASDDVKAGIEVIRVEGNAVQHEVYRAVRPGSSPTTRAQRGVRIAGSIVVGLGLLLSGIGALVSAAWTDPHNEPIGVYQFSDYRSAPSTYTITNEPRE